MKIAKEQVKMVEDQMTLMSTYDREVMYMVLEDTGHRTNDVFSSLLAQPKAKLSFMDVALLVASAIMADLEEAQNDDEKALESSSV